MYMMVFLTDTCISEHSEMIGSKYYDFVTEFYAFNLIKFTAQDKRNIFYPEKNLETRSEHIIPSFPLLLIPHCFKFKPCLSALQLYRSNPCVCVWRTGDGSKHQKPENG
jgi:hypothetical protein